MSLKASAPAGLARAPISPAFAAFGLLGGSAVAALVVSLLLDVSHRAPHDTIADSAGAVGSLFAHNAGVALIPLALLALGWDSRAVLREWGDGLVIVSLVTNGAVVGYAFARAGLELASYLPHLPLEWGAIAIPAGCWYAFRRAAPEDRRRALLRALARTIALLLVAAVLEVYAVPVGLCPPTLTALRESPASQSPSRHRGDLASPRAGAVARVKGARGRPDPALAGLTRDLRRGYPIYPAAAGSPDHRCRVLLEGAPHAGSSPALPPLKCGRRGRLVIAAEVPTTPPRREQQRRST